MIAIAITGHMRPDFLQPFSSAQFARLLSLQLSFIVVYKNKHGLLLLSSPKLISPMDLSNVILPYLLVVC